MKNWPDGFTPDPAQPHYLNEPAAHDHFAEQVRSAARAYAEAFDDPDLREWASPFADWCAERSRSRLGNFSMPSFKRWWPVFYAEPVVFGDEDEEEDTD